MTAESHFQPFHKLNEFRPFLFFNVEVGRRTCGGCGMMMETAPRGVGGGHGR